MKRSHIPSLDDLRAFEAVARLGSVRAAAEELALTHGAISRRVSKLSHDIDMKLVEPLGRGIQVTQNGEKLATTVKLALDQISTTLDKIRTEPTDQPIVLSCERSIAMRWLIPRLSQFQDANPNIVVHLSVGGGTLDFEKDGISLAIRRLDFPINPNWKVTNLTNEAVGPVMQPSKEADFLKGNYIGLATKTRIDAWGTWLKAHPNAAPPREIRYFDHHFLMAEAAASGLGAAICPEILAVDDIASKRLIAPHGFTADGSQYGLISPNIKTQNKIIEPLINWIVNIANKRTLS